MLIVLSIPSIMEQHMDLVKDKKINSAWNFILNLRLQKRQVINIFSVTPLG